MDFRSAVCDTGPLVSALQSSSVFLLTSLFSELHIPSVCMAELIEDGRNPARHLGEAQAIALALREAYQEAFLLLDELAARAVAQEFRLRITGFPGVLLLAVQDGMITPADLVDRLEKCRQQGTHYSTELIQRVHEMARSGS